MVGRQGGEGSMLPLLLLPNESKSNIRILMAEERVLAREERKHGWADARAYVHIVAAAAAAAIVSFKRSWAFARKEQGGGKKTEKTKRKERKKERKKQSQNLTTARTTEKFNQAHIHSTKQARPESQQQQHRQHQLEQRLHFNIYPPQKKSKTKQSLHSICAPCSPGATWSATAPSKPEQSMDGYGWHGRAEQSRPGQAKSAGAWLPKKKKEARKAAARQGWNERAATLRRDGQQQIGHSSSPPLLLTGLHCRPASL